MKNYSDHDYEKIAALIEAVLKLRGATGYGVGHPHKVKGTRAIYGRSKYSLQPDESLTEPKDREPVEVSRAFKGERRNEKWVFRWLR